MKGTFGGGITSAFTFTIGFIGTIVGVIVGKGKKLPSTSVLDNVHVEYENDEDLYNNQPNDDQSETQTNQLISL